MTETLLPPAQTAEADELYNAPDAFGHFGQFGGKYAPETLDARA